MKKLFFIFFLSLTIYKSYSCSCAHDKITQEIYSNYSLIFTGEIVEVEDCDNLGYQKFTFEIEQIFKGQTTKLISGYNNCGGVCNFLYEKRQKWLVYSNPNKYGLINDSDACNQSIIIHRSENKWLSGKDYVNYKKNLNFEIDFLKSRKTKNSEIINFQFKQYIPFLKNIFILGVILSIFLLCFKLNIKTLPYSVGLGIINGILYYTLVKNFLFPKLMDYRTIHILLIFSFILISTFIYFISTKEKLRLKKLIIYSYCSYISTVITTIYVIFTNNHQEVEYNVNFYKALLFLIGIGILFSLFVTIFILIGKKIQLKIRKGSI